MVSLNLLDCVRKGARKREVCATKGLNNQRLSLKHKGNRSKILSVVTWVTIVSISYIAIFVSCSFKPPYQGTLESFL